MSRGIKLYWIARIVFLYSFSCFIFLLIMGLTRVQYVYKIESIRSDDSNENNQRISSPLLIHPDDDVEMGIGYQDVIINQEKLMIINASCPYDLLGKPLMVQLNCPKDDLTNMCHNLTCKNILTLNLDQDQNFYSFAKNFSDTYEKNTGKLSDPDLIQLAKNCPEFLKVRGYQEKLSWHDDEDFPIAYNILAHESAEQVERLIYALFRPHNQICIHGDFYPPWDKYFEQALRAIISCLPDNMFLSSKLEDVVYGGVSRLQADVNCMEDHVKRATKWKYLINTAGQAFPLRSNREMVRILQSYRGTNDVEGMYGKDIVAIRNLWSPEFKEHKDHRGTIKTGRTNPPPPHDIDIAKGSAYGAFSRPFVEFVVNDQRAKDLLLWMTTTWSPDELYWATLNHRYVNPHLNAPGGYSGFPGQDQWLTTYVNWDLKKCQGKQGHSMCVFGVGDVPNLVQQPHLFANKFNSGFQTLGLEYIRAWLEHKEKCPVTYDYSLYRNLPRVKELDRKWKQD